MLITREESKFDKFNEFKVEQSENICDTFLTENPFRIFVGPKIIGKEISI